MPSGIEEYQESVLVQVNTPIGYSKNPLIYDCRIEPRMSSNWVDLQDYLKPSCGPGGLKVSLEGLPFEIRENIANNLSQFDSLNLLQTSRTMYASTIRRLYQHVVIDKTYSQFNKECDFCGMDNRNFTLEQESLACSFIKSAFSFRRFINPYIHGYSNRGGMVYSYVEKIQCIDLPDSLNAYDHDFNDHLSELFGKLVHLKELIWLNDYFRLEYLNALPNKSSIKSLVLNIKFSNYLNELPILENMEYDSESEDMETRNALVLNFPKLQNFQIRPFDNSNRLMKIINCFLLSYNAQNAENISENLRILKLSRFEKDICVLLPPCQDLVAFDDGPIAEEMDLNTISSAFCKTRLEYLKNITTFLLNNCIVTPDDAEMLRKTLNLSSLKVLELKNISEFQRVLRVTTAETINQVLQTSFLCRLAPYLHNLEKLLLDFREAYADSVPSFLNSLPSRKLKALDLIIRYNSTKMLPYDDDCEALYRDYAHAIVSNGAYKSLQKLALEIKEENAFCDLSITLPAVFYSQIAKCSHLKSLRLNISDGTNFEHFIQLIQRLTRLTHLDIFGSQAGGAPHLGLGMIHPTVYDEWFKVQHVAIVFMHKSRSLRYIRINKCIFECQDGQVNPRDGIDRWFNSLVRVGNF